MMSGFVNRNNNTNTHTFAYPRSYRLRLMRDEHIRHQRHAYRSPRMETRSSNWSPRTKDCAAVDRWSTSCPHIPHTAGRVESPCVCVRVRVRIFEHSHGNGMTNFDLTTFFYKCKCENVCFPRKKRGPSRFLSSYKSADF